MLLGINVLWALELCDGTNRFDARRVLQSHGILIRHVSQKFCLIFSYMPAHPERG